MWGIFVVVLSLFFVSEHVCCLVKVLVEDVSPLIRAAFSVLNERSLFD